MQERLGGRDLSCFARSYSRNNILGFLLFSLYGTDAIKDAQNAEQRCICRFSHR